MCVCEVVNPSRVERFEVLGLGSWPFCSRLLLGLGFIQNRVLLWLQVQKAGDPEFLNLRLGGLADSDTSLRPGRTARFPILQCVLMVP